MHKSEWPLVINTLIIEVDIDSTVDAVNCQLLTDFDNRKVVGVVTI